MKQAQGQQKSYIDQRHRDLEFSMGDKVFINVAPFKHMIRFRKKGKLALRYIDPYEIVGRVGRVAYRLTLLTSMERIHEVFHVSSLHTLLTSI